MENHDLVTKILLGLIVLHLVAGFGYMIYMLSPRKGDKTNEEGDEKE